MSGTTRESRARHARLRRSRRTAGLCELGCGEPLLRAGLCRAHWERKHATEPPPSGRPRNHKGREAKRCDDCGGVYLDGQAHECSSTSRNQNVREPC